MVKKHRPTILIVEDEISVSMELQEMLEESGYDIVGAAVSGEDAIDMAEKSMPDLVLMDIKLSGRLDGIDAATRIRSETGIPAVFLTGHGEKELIQRAINADPLGYVMKPLNQAQILAAVQLALGHLERDRIKFTPSYMENMPDVSFQFTTQELWVADMIRDGRNSEAISHELALKLNPKKTWHTKYQNRSHDCTPVS